MSGEDMRSTGIISGLLSATTLVGVTAVVPAARHRPDATSAARIYVIVGQTVEALDASTLAPIPLSRGPVVTALRSASQVVPSPDGSIFGSVQSATGAAGRL